MESASAPTAPAPGHRVKVETFLRILPLVAFTFSALIHAFGFVAHGETAQIWDDALFFRRVAYNTVHHGVAGWNYQDGPVFMNTSQLYQLITTLLLPLAPHHFNAAVVLWSAVCASISYLVLWNIARKEGGDQEIERAGFLFVMMHAPPIFLAITTGMETCTIFLVLAAFLYVIMNPRLRHPVLLAAMNLLVFLTRPDAILMSFILSVSFLGVSRRTFQFCALTAIGMSAVCLSLYAYYGTPLPLATFLKISQLSVYDREYLALGNPDKLKNLVETGLVTLPLLPLIVMRFDRANLTLVGAALAFVAFHGMTTNEIMGYHARFYAPALPLLFLAGLRGLSNVRSAEEKLAVVVGGAAVAGLALIAFKRAWIENATVGFDANLVPLRHYVIYFLGIPILALLRLIPQHVRRIVVPCLAAFVTIAGAVRMTAAQPLVVKSDLRIYERALQNDQSLTGIDVIRRCFSQPVQLVHSELGIPGVLLSESRIIDYTGLANPSVARGHFDFEKLCAGERPEFIFRPHWTHKRLNEQLSASPCLASQYTGAAVSESLFVRNDLIEKFNVCAADH